MERLNISVKKIKKGTSYNKINKKTSSHFQVFIKKIGQLQNIIVVEKSGYYEIIYGQEYFDDLKSIFSEIYCINLGKISEEDEKIINIFLNEIHYEKDNLKFGLLLSTMIKSKNDAKYLSYFLPFDMIDLMRYTQLANVDWQEELKEEIGPIQQTIF